MLEVSVTLQLQMSPDSFLFTTLLIRSSMLVVIPSPTVYWETQTQPQPQFGAMKRIKRYYQSGQLQLTPSSLAMTLLLVILVNQLNLDFSVMMTTKKFQVLVPNRSSICCLMYKALGLGSYLKNPLAVLADSMKAVIISLVTPAPMQFPVPDADEQVFEEATVKAKVLVIMKKRQRSVLIDINVYRFEVLLINNESKFRFSEKIRKKLEQDEEKKRFICG